MKVYLLEYEGVTEWMILGAYSSRDAAREAAIKAHAKGPGKRGDHCVFMGDSDDNYLRPSYLITEIDVDKPICWESIENETRNH